MLTKRNVVLLALAAQMTTACGMLDTVVITPSKQPLTIPTKFYQACLHDQAQHAALAYTASNHAALDSVNLQFVDKVNSATKHPGMVAMGVTLSNVNNQYLLTAYSLTSKKGEVCAHFTHHLTYTLAKPIEIHISNQIRNNACFTSYVYQHELQHVNNVRVAIDSSVREYQERAKNNLNEVMFFANKADFEAYKAEYTTKINAQAKNWLDGTLHKIRSADEALDSIESYKNVKDIGCN